MKRIFVSLTVIAVLTGLACLAGAATSTSKHREQRIAIDVTEKGFEPAVIHANAGEPLLLVVTRRVERTCAKEIVIQDRKIHRMLPLHQAVEIRLAAQKPGTLRYACGMDMLAGTLVIQ